MTSVTNTSRVLLNAPPSEVFAYVSDITHHPEWSGGPLKIEALTPGPVAIGSQYRSTGGVSDRTNELRVTAYEPPTRFAFVAKDPDFGEVTHEFTFKAENGGTLMERAVTAPMPFLLSIIFRLYLYPSQGKPLMDKAMANLKAKWEKSKQ